MKLGAFSVSLAVKDLAVSHDFYQKLGFTQLGGNAEHGYLILKNGTTVIGLFQGMFEENILTFNPGWDQGAQAVDPFTDIRQIHEQLAASGVETGPLKGEASGPAHVILKDPDGNVIMLDQHR